MADIQAAPSNRPFADDEHALRRPQRRAGIRIDMTPMVDIAFLLLIFFMVTTVFRRPLAMEVNMPAPGAKIEVPESNVMTVFINRDEAMFYRQGTGPLQTVTWDGLRERFVAGQQANPDLIVLVKIHREARYEGMVEMMDTLEDAHMQRFSLIPLPAAEAQLLGEGR